MKGERKRFSTVDAALLEAITEKSIGFDIDNKKTIACVVQKGRRERSATLPSKVEAMPEFLQQEKGKDRQVHLTFDTG